MKDGNTGIKNMLSPRRVTEYLYGLVGISCLWAWVHEGVFSGSTTSASSQYLSSIWSVHNLTVCILMGLITVFAEQLYRLFNKRLLVILSLFIIFGDLLMEPDIVGTSGYLFVTGNILSSAGDCILIVYWIIQVSQYKTIFERRSITLVGMIFSFLLYLLVGQLHLLSGFIASSIYALVSVFCLYKLLSERKLQISTNGQGDKEPSRTILPISYFAVFIIFSLALYYIRGGMAAQGSLIQNENWAIIFAYLAVIFIVIVLVDALLLQRFDISVIAYLMVLLIIAALFFYATGLQNRDTIFTLVCVGFFFYLPMYYQMMADYIVTTKVNPYKVAALGPFLNTVGSILGATLGFLASSLNGTLFLVVTLLIIYTVLGAGLLLASNKLNNQLLLRLLTREENISISDIDTDVPKNGIFRNFNETLDSAKLEQLIDSRCSLIAKKFSLTKKEYETLCLLARGRSLQTIAKDQGISLNTVKSHVLHIYQKTNVHSHEELFKLLEMTKTYHN